MPMQRFFLPLLCLCAIFAPIFTLYPEPPVASLHGTFVDAENRQPIAGLLVRVASEKRDSVYPDRDFAHETETAADGTFFLTTPNDAQNYYAFSIMALHSRYQARLWRFEMSPGKNRYDLGEIEMRKVLTLQGSVVGASQPRTGCVVRLKMHAKSADFFRAAATTELITETDNQGNFGFTELYPIEYTLTISENNVIIGYIESVHPQNGERLTVRLPKLETLHGTVVDAQGSPVPEAQLYAMRLRETPHGHGALLAVTETDANGKFQMEVLETEPSLLSVEIGKKGYFTTGYENVNIREKPLLVTLEKGVTITGRVILPANIAAEGHYAVKIFSADIPLQPTLHPMALLRPLLTKRFPVAEPTFTIEGLFAEKYAVYVVGDGIAAASVEVDAAADTTTLLTADAPTKRLQGYVYWADTGEPVRNALITRSWYPWELDTYDMSMTLERFETETDVQGQFQFENVTDGRYQLRIRAVNAALDEKTGSYQRALIQKLVDIPACGNAYHIYVGRQDGMPYDVGRRDME